MSNENSGPHDGELAPDQHAPMSETGSPWRDCWRYVFFILPACQILVSSVEEGRRRSVALAGIFAAPFNRVMLSTSGTGNQGDSRPNGIVRILPASAQVSLDLFSDTDNEKISEMLKEKDLVSLREYGGVQRIAEALGTDLEMEIPGDEQDLLLRHMANKSQRKPAPTFLQCLAKACNK